MVVGGMAATVARIKYVYAATLKTKGKRKDSKTQSEPGCGSEGIYFYERDPEAHAMFHREFVLPWPNNGHPTWSTMIRE